MRCRYWLLKIRALAEAGFWQVLEAFAKEKKSPVGYRPFVEACLKYGTAEQRDRSCRRWGREGDVM